MNEQNIVIQSLGLSLKTEIKYLTKAYLMESKENELEKIQIVLLVTNESLLILSSDFNSIQLNFCFDKIKEISILLENKNLLIIQLKSKGATSQSKIELIVKERKGLIKALSCYYSIYHMVNNGSVIELPIREVTNFNSNTMLLEQNMKNVNMSPPSGYKLYEHKSGYFFFIPTDTEILGPTFSMKIYNSTIKMNILINDKNLIEMLYDNKTERDVINVFNKKINDYLEQNYSFFIYLKWYYPYNKKMNLNNDNSIWECFRAEIKTSKGIKGKKGWESLPKNCCIILMRRKFIPPFYDSYQDIMISLSEPVNENNLNPFMTKEAECLIETVADSFFDKNKFFSLYEYQELLQSKVDGLLLDYDSLSFFYHNLGIFGNKCYTEGLKFLYKLISFCGSEFLSIKKEIWAKLIELNKKFETEGYKIRLENCSIDSILQDFFQLINTNGSSEYYTKYQKSWESKIWIYLEFCINGGITEFSLQDLCNYYNENYENGKLKGYLYQIKRIMNLNAYNSRLERIDLQSDTIAESIRIIDYNENIFNYFVEKGFILHLIPKIENIALIFQFLLKSNVDNNLLRSINLFFKKTPSNLKSCFSIVIPNLITIYKMRNLTSNMAGCKCLIQLSSRKEDQINRRHLIDCNVLGVIVSYLDSPNEKIIFASLQLLNNLLSEYKGRLTELTMKNPLLIKKLINLLLGTKISKTSHEIRVIKSVYVVLINLLKLSPMLIREKIKNEIKDKNFFDYLIAYLYNAKNKIGEWPKDDLLSVHYSILKFLDMFLRKNPEMKSKLKFDKIINDLSEESLPFLENLLKTQFKLSQIKEEAPEIITLKTQKIEMFLKFALNLMMQNSDLTKKLKSLKDSPFLNLIQLLDQNRQENNIAKFSENISSLKEALDLNKSISINDVSLSKIDEISKSDISNLDINGNNMDFTPLDDKKEEFSSFSSFNEKKSISNNAGSKNDSELKTSDNSENFINNKSKNIKKKHFKRFKKKV